MPLLSTSHRPLFFLSFSISHRKLSRMEKVIQTHAMGTVNKNLPAMGSTMGTHNPITTASQATVLNNVGGSMYTDEYFDLLPPGFRFKPTDQELIDHYLWNKIWKRCLPPNRIRDVDLYKFNPQQLFERYKLYGENELYFFTPREKRYANGTRPNRNTGDGWWKASGGDKPICSKGRVVGYKKSLVFYEKNARDGSQGKTNWLMQEYTVKLQNNPSRYPGDTKLDNLVLCKIYQTGVKSKNNQSSMHHNVVDYSLPSCANNSGACSLDSAVDGREHAKPCDFDVEDWVDRAQLHISTNGESSDVMLNLLWSEN